MKKWLIEQIEAGTILLAIAAILAALDYGSCWLLGLL